MCMHSSLTKTSSRMWTRDGGLLCRMSLCPHVCNALSCFSGIRYALLHLMQQDVSLADQQSGQHCQWVCIAAPICGEPLPVKCGHAMWTVPP